MPPPPAKRQKRLVILSSDDDEEWVPSVAHVDGNDSAKNNDSISTSKQTDSEATATKRSLPTRPRNKPTDKKTSFGLSATIKSSPDSSPKKPNRKSKPRAKIQTSKPISSFFNAENQRQALNSHAQSKREEPERENEEEDLIEDDSAVEDKRVDKLRGLQDTTRLVLDRRKKPPLSTPIADGSTQVQRLPTGSQGFKIAGNATGRGRDIHSQKEANARDVHWRPWAERFGPTNLEELAVHKKKVSDVRNWLEKVFQGRDHKRLLILRGPSGAGKTATISILAKAMNFELAEWRNPVGSEFSSECYLSMSAQFEDFLGRSGMFGGLELTDSAGNEAVMLPPIAAKDENRTMRKVIVLEEFPNTILSTSSALQSFRSSLLQYLAVNTPSMGSIISNHRGLGQNTTPLVMIITETRPTTTTAASDSFTVHRLLGSDFLSHPGVSIIDFNPIAPTLLTKALDLLIQKEARVSGRRRVPGLSVLRRLGEVGDVRSAIGSLEFLCIRGEDGDDWNGRGATRARKSANPSSALTKMEKESLEMVTQRESSLGLFHAVGKVVYNKRNDPNRDEPNAEPLQQPPDHLAEHARLRIPQVSVDQLIDETGTDISTFVAALHENYVMSCEGTNFTDALNGCLGALSESDLLLCPRGGSFGNFGSRSFYGATSDSLRQDEISFQLAVRGVLFALPDPVNRRSHPIPGKRGGNNDTYKMFYPTSVRLSRQKEEVEGLLNAWSGRFRAGLPRLAENKSQSAAANAPIRISPNCTKSELILERLPYITKIEQRNPASLSTYLSRLERITQFHGVDAPNNDASGDEDTDDVTPVTAWTTNFPANGKPGNAAPVIGVGPGGKETGTLALPVEEELGRLWLSDDDIVDD